MNKVILMGRLARDPEVKYTAGSEPLAVCRFTTAVDKPYSSKRQEGEATADFISCVCFGKRGEAIGQYLRKGNKIALTGRIQVRQWKDNNGNNRYATEVVAEDWEFCENKAANNDERAGTPTQDAWASSNTEVLRPARPYGGNEGKAASNSENGFYSVDDGEDDLPF